MTERDSWCTPLWITSRLSIVDLDPCSNPRSTVKAKRSLMLERGENGLTTRWDDLTVWLQPPWSDPDPWAKKVCETKAFMALMLEDASTDWWKLITAYAHYRLSFRKRVGFDPPPGVDDESGNNRPCVLLCDEFFYGQIRDSFKPFGQWWKLI